MIFSISKSVFSKAVALVAPIASKSSLPILDYIMIKSLDGAIELYATNLVQFVRVIVSADVSEPGEIALWSKGISELLAALPDQKVIVKTSERTYKAEIACGRHKSTLPGVDPSDAPLFPSVDGLELFEVQPSILLDMIDGVISCVGDDTRPALSGVRLCDGAGSDKAGQFRSVATNGYHLGVSSLGGGVGNFDVVIPAKSAAILVKLLGLAGKVTVAVGDSRACFSLVCGSDDIHAVAFSSSLIASNYPDVYSIVPASHTTEAEIEIRPFLDALDIAKMFVTSKTHDSVAINIQPPRPGNDGRILLFVHGDEGDFTSEIPAVVSGAGLHLHASCKYLQQAATACPTERTIFTATTQTRPMVLAAAADCTVDWFHLIMPVDPKS